MTPDEIVTRMEEINKTAALFDWLEMFDSHQCECSYEVLMAGTCELTVKPPTLDDIMGGTV
jgi:hypothetical protein